MNDKKFLMDILEMEKNMAVNMTYALNEASNDCLYQLESETKKKINEALNTLNQELNK